MIWLLLLLPLALIAWAVWGWIYWATDIYCAPPPLWRLAGRQYMRHEKQQQQLDRRNQREVMRLARVYQRRIVNVLDRRDLCKIYHREKKQIVYSVQFDCCVVPYDATAVYYHVDPNRLPRGVRTEDLMDPDVCAEIGRSIGRAVATRDMQEKGGAWYVVNLGEGVSRLPVVYHFQVREGQWNVLDMLTESRSYEVAAGMGENRALYTIDVRGRHILIGGATGGGKTNWVRQALCTLALRNSPDALQFILADFKRGVGLGFFRDLPHCTEFVRDMDRIESVLRGVLRDMERRYEMFERAECEDIEGYNYRRSTGALPYIVVVIDEFADLMLDPDRGGEFRDMLERLVLRLAQQGRGAGIGLWLGTQTPKREVITTLIKYNCTIKLAFSCTQGSASRIMLDNDRAVNLERPGRVVLQEPGEAGLELQSPLLEHRDARQIVADIASGREAAPPPPVDHEALLRYSLSNLGGALPRLPLADHFGRGSYVQRLLASWDYDPRAGEPVLELDGARFVVLPSNRGNLPRQLYPLNGSQPPDPKEWSEILHAEKRAPKQSIVNNQ